MCLYGNCCGIFEALRTLEDERGAAGQDVGHALLEEWLGIGGRGSHLACLVVWHRLMMGGGAGGGP